MPHLLSTAVLSRSATSLTLRMARRVTLVAGLLAGGAWGTGCATTGSAAVYGPDLVYVSPGVQVIADWDEPIFYSDGYYWRNGGGVWYRSSYYDRGWVYARPPGAVLSIHSPHVYRHYRPQGWAPRGRAAPVVRGGPPPRSAGPPPSRPGFGPGFRGAPGPVVRGGPAGGPPMQQGGGHHGPPPAGPRARSPIMDHGHGHGPHR